jgi:hypothetical protein
MRPLMRACPYALASARKGARGRLSGIATLVLMGSGCAAAQMGLKRLCVLLRVARVLVRSSHLTDRRWCVCVCVRACWVCVASSCVLCVCVLAISRRYICVLLHVCALLGIYLQLASYLSKLGIPLVSCGRDVTCLRRSITAAFFWSPKPQTPNPKP